MICPSCKSNVHPTQRLAVVARCAECKAIANVAAKDHDKTYTCSGCGADGPPITAQEFISQCPLTTCLARLPSIEEQSSDLSHEVQSAPDLPPPKQAKRNEPVDAIGVCRARLAFCDEKIAELRTFEDEARKLRLMLAAIETS